MVLITGGPAFGFALNEAPPASWCTSLMGGQRHELPLIVFTVVEEIYRVVIQPPLPQKILNMVRD